MFSRVTLLEVDTMRVDVDDVLDRYRHDMLPELQRQPGYEGMLVMVNPEGQGLIMSLWSTQEAVEATMPLASAAVERFMTVFRAPPGRERYEVRLIDLPTTGVDGHAPQPASGRRDVTPGER